MRETGNEEGFSALAAGLFILVGAGSAAIAHVRSAADYVLSLYDPHALGGTARYGPRLQTLWDDCEAKAKREGYACMDFSMIVMGNDFALSDVHAVPIEIGAARAVVDARFKNFGKPTVVTYDLLRDSEGWAIDEIRSGCYVLSRALLGELPSC